MYANVIYPSPQPTAEPMDVYNAQQQAGTYARGGTGDARACVARKTIPFD